MKSRNSSFEVLRILCIISILGIHTMDGIMTVSLNRDMAAVTFLQSVFNISSSCLMMIAGFFGIKFTLKKFINIEGMCLFWSLMLLGQRVLEGITPGREELLAAFLPFASSFNWFVTGYLCIMILSPYINQIPEKLSKKDFEKLLMILVTIFYVFPTLFYFDITGSGGKSVVHLFVVYLVGRYIAKYNQEPSKKFGKCLIKLDIVILIIFALNILAEILGMRFWFARDCSLLILVAAMYCVKIFSCYHFSNTIIDFLSRNILSVILCEKFIKKILVRTKVGSTLLPDADFGRKIWYVKLFAWCLCIMIMGILAEKVRFMLFGKPESYVADGILKIAMRGKNFEDRK